MFLAIIEDTQVLVILGLLTQDTDARYNYWIVVLFLHNKIYALP